MPVEATNYLPQTLYYYRRHTGLAGAFALDRVPIDVSFQLNIDLLTQLWRGAATENPTQLCFDRIQMHVTGSMTAFVADAYDRKDPKVLHLKVKAGSCSDYLLINET
jgi:hypothetical protein